MIAPADVCTDAESRTIRDLNHTDVAGFGCAVASACEPVGCELGDGELSRWEAAMYRGLVGSGVEVVPGKRYTLAEVCAIVHAGSIGMPGQPMGGEDGQPLTAEAAAVLVSLREPEGPRRPTSDHPSALRQRTTTAERSFRRAFSWIPTSERAAILGEAGCRPEAAQEAVTA